MELEKKLYNYSCGICYEYTNKDSYHDNYKLCKNCNENTQIHKECILKLLNRHNKCLWCGYKNPIVLKKEFCGDIECWKEIEDFKRLAHYL